MGHAVRPRGIGTEALCLKRRKSCLIALGIVLVSKFSNGAWITALVIPAFVLVFLRMKRYNERLARVTRSEAPLDLSNLTEPVVVVPLRRLDQVAQKALRFAITISRDVYVVQVMAEELDTEDLRERWRERVEEPVRRSGHFTPPQLVVVRSAYRKFFERFLPSSSSARLALVAWRYGS
jgi:hypothetical protein